MAEAARKASKLTTLRVGKVEIAVGLYTNAAKPGALAEFATAGPNGGVLKARQVARPVPVAEQQVQAPAVPVDPFATELGPAPAQMAAPAPTALVVPGEYGRELVEEGSGVIVPADEVRRGIRDEETGAFIDCTDQLAEIAERTKLERMEVVSFVDVTHIPRAWVTGANYIGAADEAAPKPLRLFYEAMRSMRRAAVVKVTKRSRQTLGVIAASEGVLVMYELQWRENVKAPPVQAKAIAQAHVTTEEVEMAIALVRAMSGTVDTLTDLRDDAIALREALYEEATLLGHVTPVEQPPAPTSEQDVLLGQLEASLAQVGS